MGSCFNVVIPTKDHEVQLRRIEHGITDIVFKISLDKDGTVASERPKIKETGNEPYKVLNQDLINFIESFGGIDIYEAIVDGHKSEIFVSSTAFTIVRTDESESGQATNDSATESFLTTNKAKVLDVIKAEMIDSVFLEVHLKSCLDRLSINGVMKTLSNDEKFNVFTFSMPESGAEIVIDNLQTVGIGKKYSSQFSVVSTTIFRKAKVKEAPPHQTDPSSASNEESVSGGGVSGLSSSSSDEEDNSVPGSGALSVRRKKISQWAEFKKTIKSRLTVAQVIQNVQADAVLTFDFVILIMVAGLIAGYGLLESSNVDLVASMLISPLMGPIMALTFGIVIKDKKLIKISLISELFGLFLCLIVGVCIGVAVGSEAFEGPWAGVKLWPTEEMTARGLVRSLKVGAVVAFASGAGVALSILAGNAGSLVGVAISASLLPPAVNCGIFWGLSLIIFIRESVAGQMGHLSCNHNHNVTLHANYSINYTPFYCENPIHEYAIAGIVSMTLTLVNIVLIVLTGLAILKIKEVAPHTTRTQLHRFWKEDLRNFRQYNVTNKDWRSLLAADVKLMDKDFMAELNEDTTYSSVVKRVGDNDMSNLAETSHTSIKQEKPRKQSAHSFEWFGWFRSTPKPDPKPEHERPKLV